MSAIGARTARQPCRDRCADRRRIELTASRSSAARTCRSRGIGTQISPEIPHEFVDFERVFGMVSVLPRVLRSPEPHHPHSLVVGAKRRFPRGCSAWIVASVVDAMRRRSRTSSSRCRRGDRPARGRVRAARVGRATSVGSARRMVRRRRRPGCGVTPGCARATPARDRGRPRLRAAAEDRCGVARRVRSPVARRRRSPRARVEGHDLKLRALEDTVPDPRARGRPARAAARVCALPRTVPGPTAPNPREHDGVTISPDLRRPHDPPRPSSPRARPRSSRPRSTRSPTHPPTATPAPRPAAGPTPS